VEGVKAEEIAYGDPVEAAERLRTGPGLAFLDSAMRHESLGRYSYLAADPVGVFSVRDGRGFWNVTPEPDAPLVALRRRLAARRVETAPGLPPFQGGAIGYLGYEAGALFDRAPNPAGAEQLRFGFYDAVIAWDHRDERCWIIAQPGAEARAEESRALLAAPGPAAASSGWAALDWRSNFTPESYAAAVERVKDYILDGDIYQANIAQRFSADLPEGFDRWALFGRLRETNPATFAAFLDFGDLAIASSSPERFMRCRSGRVETRPIKGTAARSADPAQDLVAGEALIRSEKDRAENVMIVDLLRNDLSRVCKPGSVEVPTLCGLESYANVHHLVSVVLGDLRAGRDALDLIAASFPGGSITGAPKIRAMEIIREIERGPRGVYCGAIGWLGYDGAMDLNIAIRTVAFEGRKASLQAGGGITVLSDPAAEYAETLDKARRVFAAFDAREAP
jgi:para-aminobenzoate synthetase component 1